MVMESAVRKSLLAPVKSIKHCVSGEEELSGWTNHKAQRRSKGKTHSPSISPVKDPRPIRPYQAELEKERKSREALNAQKNAERAAMRAYFRRKYHLNKDARDAEHLRAAGKDVSLPADLARMIGCETSGAESFSFPNVFQRFSFSPVPTTQTLTPTCKVM